MDEDLAGKPMFGYSISDNQYTDLLDRYVNSKRFFNTLSLLETYFNACGAKVIVTDEDAITRFKEAKRDYIETQKSYLDDLNITEGRSEAIKKAISDTERNIQFLEFSDFCNDYSKILGYMF